MTIRYLPDDNPVVEGRKRAILLRGKTRSFEDFLEFVDRHGTTLTRADVLASVQVMADWIEANAGEGRQVDFGLLGHTRLGLAGDFDSDDPPRPEDWTLTLGWQASPALKKAVDDSAKEAGLERREPPPKTPNLATVRCGGALNRYRAPGILEVRGWRLKFDPAREDEGVFLEPEDGPERRLDLYQTAHPKTIIALVPEGLTGPQRLVLRTRRQPDAAHPSTTRFEHLLLPDG